VPYTVSVSFDNFVHNISLTGDHAETAEARRKRLVELLQNDFTILDSFPTGSIPKGTALKSHADLDIIVVLHYGKHLEGKRPSAVLGAIQKSLSGYKTGVRRNGQAVTLYYDSWPNVDVVPVARVTDDKGAVAYYEVPDMNTETWIHSRPRTHASNIADRAKTCGGRFLPLIRMIKEWNRVHSDLLSSYHIEAIALKVCTNTLDAYPWGVYQFFSEAVSVAGRPLWYEGAYADQYLDNDTRKEIVKRLETAKARALNAWHKTYGDNNDDKGAIEIWRQIFGERFPAYG